MMILVMIGIIIIILLRWTCPANSYAEIGWTVDTFGPTSSNTAISLPRCMQKIKCTDLIFDRMAVVVSWSTMQDSDDVSMCPELID